MQIDSYVLHKPAGAFDKSIVNLAPFAADANLGLSVDLHVDPIASLNGLT